MKKLLLLVPFCIAFFVGCNKDQTASSEDQNVEYATFDMEGNSVNLEGVSMEAAQDGFNESATSRSENISANGHYAFGTTDVTFSAMKNNGGTHGKINFNGELYNFKADVVCILVSGNKAVVGGQVTEVTAPANMNVGDYVGFGVWDLGEGNNGPLDKKLNVLFRSRTIPPCTIMASFFNAPPFFWSDVEEGNQIQVKD